MDKQILGSIGIAHQIATQAQQEAGTDATRVVTPGRQHFHPSAAKGWVRFNGTGTVAIEGSYNVASITDNTTGDYTINWATDFADTSYAAFLSYNTGASAFAVPAYVDKTAAAWRVKTATWNGSAGVGGAVADSTDVCAMAVGDFA